MVLQLVQAGAVKVELDGIRALSSGESVDAAIDSVFEPSPAGPSGTAVASEQTRGGDDD